MTAAGPVAAVIPAGSIRLAEAAVVLEWVGDSLVAGCADGTLLMDRRLVPTHPASSGVVVAVAEGPTSELASIDHGGRVRVGMSVQHLGGWGRGVWWCGMDRLVAVTSEGIHSGPLGRLRPIVHDVGGVREACLLSGRRMVVGTTDAVLFLDPELGSVDDGRPNAMVCRFALSPTAELLAVGDAAGSAHVVRLDSGSGVEIDGYGHPIRLVCWAGHHLVVVDGKLVTAWPVTADGEVPADEPTCLVTGEAPITTLSSPANRAVVAAGDARGTLWLLLPDRASDPLATLHLGARVVASAWSRDGTRLAVGCVDGRLHRYDIVLTEPP